jgi:TPR repeat protein
MRLLLALTLVLPCAHVVAAVPAADAAWAKGDYRTAFAEAIEPAIRGDAHAQFLIGEAYRLGRSVDPNFPLAEQWYARAASQGDAGAAAELGLLLASQHLESTALPWLTIAAQHGDARATFALAAIYYNGDAVPRDDARAFALMSRAAAAGLPAAQAGLSTLRMVLPPDVQAKGTALIASVLSPLGENQIAAAPARPSASPSRSSSGTAALPVRLQLGAYRSAGAAERAWTLLAGQVDGLARIGHAVVRAGAVYRLQAQLPDGRAAADFCRHLREGCVIFGSHIPL